MEQIKERHGDIIAGHAQAQIRKLFAERAGRIEGVFSTLIPKPALLRRRLEMTGKNISLAKYSIISLGICLFVVMVFLVADRRCSWRSSPACSSAWAARISSSAR